MLVLIAATETWRIRAPTPRRRRGAEQARRSEQRLEIARDLHDVLAHSISLINVQASTALHLLDAKPEQARPALEAIKRASGEALTEVRGVLETLRRPDDGTATKAPAPTLARVDDLTAEAKRPRLDIKTVVEGDAAAAAGERRTRRVPDLPGGGHERDPPRRAGQRAPEADLRRRRADRRGRRRRTRARQRGGGNGLTGMRERAAALGGSLGPARGPGGGFRVEARLPAR